MVTVTLMAWQDVGPSWQFETREEAEEFVKMQYFHIEEEDDDE